MLEKVIEKSADFQVFKSQQQKGTLPSSLLLSSKDNFYSFEFCKSLACLLFDGNACGNCENCLKVRADAHPDLKVYPSKDKLLVADSEEIVMESFIKPIFADKKIFIIRNIDEANDASQNKLLKVLEEPPKNVYFLLTCVNIEKVLPTIRSRCQKTELSKLDDNVIEGLLGRADEELKVLALQVADVQVGKAIALSKKKDFVSLCKDSVGIITRLKSSKEVLEVSKRLQQYKDEFLLIMEVLSIAVSDLLKVKAGKKDLVRLTDFENDYAKVSGDYTIRALCEIALLIDEVVKERGYNVSPVISLENFLLNVLEVKYLCR